MGKRITKRKIIEVKGTQTGLKKGRHRKKIWYTANRKKRCLPQGADETFTASLSNLKGEGRKLL